MQVELTDERIAEMMTAGKWKLPPHEDIVDTLERDDQLQEILSYIQEVRGGFKEGKDKFPLLGTAGMTGIGKTQLLLNAKKRAEEQLKVKGAYFTFNGQGRLKADFLHHLPERRQQYGDAFGRTLLGACGVKEEAKGLNLEECLRILRKFMGAGDHEHIVLFIDEVGFLDEQLQEGVKPPVVPLLQDLMQYMDVVEHKVIFIFSHLLEEMLRLGATSGSGRPVECLSLPALQIDTWQKEERFKRWRQAAAKYSGIHQLLLLCSGHPRSLFDGLAKVANESRALLNLNEAPTVAALCRARTMIAQVCKFESRLDNLMDDRTVHDWFNPLQQPSLKALNTQGLLVQVSMGGESKRVEAFFHPLVLCEWARLCYGNKGSRLAFHLEKAYEYDAELSEGSEKRMEGLMFNYEAVLRIALGGKPIALRKFYATDFIGEKFKDMSLVAALPTDGSDLVEFVKDFTKVNMERVIRLLEKGITVVSNKQQEVGIEYLTPWRLDTADGDLVVACVQCKFVQTRADWTKIKDRMDTAVKRFKDKQIQVIPVVYATPDEDPMKLEATYEDGVYFTEKDMFEFTRKLGILRLHTEKLGQSLKKHVPVLDRSRSEADSTGSTEVS